VNRLESAASSLSGDLVVKEKSFAKRFWACASSLLCVWFFVSGCVFYRLSGFGSRGLYYWDSTLRVHIGQTRLSTSDFLFSAMIYCGICAIVYFVFGILVRRPFAVLCGYAHLWMSSKLLFSAASFIRGIVPSTPLEGLPGHFVSGFLGAQLFFLVYCIVGIFSAPPKNEYVRLTSENP
jgi:hypothetical protein